METENLLAGYPTIVECPVAWGEMDAFGHVNNTVYFRYFENARIAYFRNLELMEHMHATGIGPILAHTQCRFRLPLTHPDAVAVGARVASLGADRFRMAYRVVSRGHRAVAADGDGLLVIFDYRKNMKAPMPEVLRQRILAMEIVTPEEMADNGTEASKAAG